MACECMLAASMVQAMEGACSLAIHEAEASAAQALKALAHPSWTDAVVATAAAMAAENAVSACAHSFIEQVQDGLPMCFSLTIIHQNSNSTLIMILPCCLEDNQFAPSGRIC